jgi:serine protease Do
MSHASPLAGRAQIATLLACLLLAVPVAAEADQESPPPRATLCQESIPELYNRVSLSVVSVEAVSINPRDVGDRVSRVAGSGVIVDGSGLIVTNSHVVFGRRAISVTLDDGTMLPASLVGADPVFDVAVIRIPLPPTGTLPVARLGDSDHVVVGEEVLTIGNPFALEQTLTRGIVSAINRILPNTPLSLMEPLIQTDASINPGSSGGPLINRCGEVIGITTAILPEAQNIGFVVPVNLVKEVMPLLIASGRVVRPWLGVQGQLVVPALKELLRIPLEDGFLVEVVEPGSPAEQQGIAGGKLDMTVGGHSVLLGGDIITVMNGVTVDDPEKLERVLRALRVGATLRMTVFRDKKLRQVEVAVTERPLLPGDILVHQSVAPLAGSGLTDSAASSRRFRFVF